MVHCSYAMGKGIYFKKWPFPYGWDGNLYELNKCILTVALCVSIDQASDNAMAVAGHGLPISA